MLASPPILIFGHTSQCGVNHGQLFLLALHLWLEPDGSLGVPLLLQL